MSYYSFVEVKGVSLNKTWSSSTRTWSNMRIFRLSLFQLHSRRSPVSHQLVGCRFRVLLHFQETHVKAFISREHTGHTTGMSAICYFVTTLPLFLFWWAILLHWCLLCAVEGEQEDLNHLPLAECVYEAALEKFRDGSSVRAVDVCIFPFKTIIVI